MKKRYDFAGGKRGAVLPNPAKKTRITIRIDDEVLEWFRKRVHEGGGGSYQTMINRALRDHIEGQSELLEETLRRVLSEVIPISRRSPRSKRTRRA
jgi:hypothetical protein